MHLKDLILANHKGSITKKEKIMAGIADCIQVNALSLGDTLPSVNELSNQLGYSRETVVKAYKELKDRGILDAKQGVGYFIASSKLDIEQTIGLVLYGFQTFQQDFYNSFRNTLGKTYKIDVFFHHNNFKIYETVLNNVLGNYSNYVIAPIQSRDAQDLLSDFPKEKLLIIDRYQHVSDDVSKITQEFEQSLILELEKILADIKRYKQIVLFFDPAKDYPKDILTATKEFCKTHKVQLIIEQEYGKHLLKKGNLFFTIGDSDLWQILKDIKCSDFNIGKEIGILSHNDSPVKEIILDGITTFSTDFIKMGEDAAKFVQTKIFTNKMIPGKLIKRNSL